MNERILRKFILETIRDLVEDTIPPGKWGGDGPVSPEDAEGLSDHPSVGLWEDADELEEEDH
jgi:hypothetical protein